MVTTGKPTVGRAVGYLAAVGTRTIVAVAVLGVLGAPIVFAVLRPAAAVGAVGLLLVVGFALLGVGLPAVAAGLARADWRAAATVRDRRSAAPPAVRVRDPATFVRPVSYAAVMVTVGGAATLLTFLVVVGALVGVVSPVLVLAGDEAVIGPVTVDGIPAAVVAAVVGAGVLALAVWAAPTVARLHCGFVDQVLTRPEQDLQIDLESTSRSRARLVRSFDVERRRIERDLHDGVQPQLMSVSMTLGMALAAMPPQASGRSDVERAQALARGTLDALRQFVRNIHPQVLVDNGLGAAVAELADSLPLDVAIDDDLPDRLPPAIESNLYFCVSELLANAAKHSDATRVETTLTEHDGIVTVAVRDDGRGGADMSPGGGLGGIADRLAALGGEMAIDSPVGGPTVVTIDAPLEEG